LDIIGEWPGFHVYRPPEYIKRVYYENDIVYRGEETWVPMNRLIEVLKAEGAIVRYENKIRLDFDK